MPFFCLGNTVSCLCKDVYKSCLLADIGVRMSGHRRLWAFTSAGAEDNGNFDEE